MSRVSSVLKKQSLRPNSSCYRNTKQLKNKKLGNRKKGGGIDADKTNINKISGAAHRKHVVAIIG